MLTFDIQNLHHLFMKRVIILLSAAALATLFCCTGPVHFLTDKEYRQQVEDDFSSRMELLSGCEAIENVLTTVESAESLREREALTFLYAYMPLGDLADYDGSLWKEGVRIAFTARDQMPWGKNVPEDLFRHFVLPLRVNNENLDSCRTVFYGELKDRVKGMSMHDAILEVNHWCHEKVNYSPSDSRTSAPLATMTTSFGRCGEESVFCAAALRAVGIPARQVYTPRWAHTDDNHAWVEVWADGEWHYLGACEPEPELDIAWFTTTVQRGMLMHTKAFGRYSDKDADVISKTACYTELNVTENYVPVCSVDIQVVDSDKNPVRDALVEFKIYNYAEFYPAIKVLSDGDGMAEATFGMGDITVWASKGGRFGYIKVSVAEYAAVKEGRSFFRRLWNRMFHPNADVISVVLNHECGENFSDELDVVPPPASDVRNQLSEDVVEINKARLAKEDSIRNAYVATFPAGDRYTVSAFGNWEEIESFIFFNSSTPQRRKCAERMLDLMNEKDLRDTQCDILMDHITGYYKKCGEKEPISDYVLNPRVANEMLVPYVEFFRERWSDSLSINQIIDITKKVKIMDEQNPARIPVSPIGVARIGAADNHSRNIFFVALCRTSGIPARLDPVDYDPQYLQNGIWRDVDLDGVSEVAQCAKGRLVLEYSESAILDNPKYEIHFTLSKLETGSPQLLNFADNEGLEGSATFKSVFRNGVSLEAGCYLLTTGTRMASGKVLSSMTIFNIPADSTVKIPLMLRHDDLDLQVLGSMNAEDKITVLESEEGGSLSTGDRSILSVTGRGYFVLCFAVSGSEPCNHSIQSLLSEAPRFPSIILFPDVEEYEKVNWNTFPKVPENVTMAVNNKLIGQICRELRIETPQMPLTVIADTFGRIVYVSQGYNIGLGEQLKRL